MNLKKIAYIIILIIIVSCQNKSIYYDLEEAILELKDLGQFEKANFEYLGSPEKSDGSTIKITFENSSIKEFNKNEFGLKSARKIYNFSKKTKEYAFVWISFKSKTTKQFIKPMALELDLNKNLIYTSNDLK